MITKPDEIERESMRIIQGIIGSKSAVHGGNIFVRHGEER